MKIKLLIVMAVGVVSWTGCQPTPRELELDLERRVAAERIKILEARVLELSGERDGLRRQVEALRSENLELAAALPNEDFQYRLVGRERIEGKLVDGKAVSALTNRPEQERVAPRWLVTFRGVQTRESYPSVEVTEAAWHRLQEGVIYTREQVSAIRRVP